jgi:hypothetical protein
MPYRELILFSISDIWVEGHHRTANREEDVPGRNRSWRECFVCARPINPEDNELWVHLSERGNLFPTNVSEQEAFDHAEGDQGWFSIGDECSTKIPNGYVLQRA